MSIKNLKLYITNRCGAVFVFFAIVALPMLLIGSALAINLATIHVQKTQLQNTADAAALAGANGVKDDIKNSIDFTLQTEYEKITKNIVSYYVVNNNTTVNLGLGSNTHPNSNYTNYTATQWSADRDIDTSAPSKIGVINMATRYATTPTGKTVQVDLRRKIPIYLFGLHFLPEDWTSVDIAVRATAKYTDKLTSSGAAFFAGSTDNDSITAWSSGINLEGNVGTNGRISLTSSDIVTLKNGNVTGNKSTQSANETVWSSKDWQNKDFTFAGTYDVGYEDAIDVKNYNTSSNKNILAMGNYIKNIINNSNVKYSINDYYTQLLPANKNYKKLWWANDGNYYKKGESDTVDTTTYPTNNALVKGTVIADGYDISEPNPVTSTGPQIYYTASTNTTTMNINTAKENGVTFNNDGTDKVMWTTGPDKYGYNVVIANGSLNATANVSNTSDNPFILISLNGDINLQQNAQSYYGMLYAPNGRIKFDGKQNTSFYGSAIGDKLLFSSQNQSFYYTSFDGIGGDSASKDIFTTFSAFADTTTSSSSNSATVNLIPNDDYNL